ncbi:hypothetical protein MP228_004485 [Amoeboaphelidium protococcarum]|nr:hypothetical protein MP228_004485 [Amoeboaphelidium protococcarum]
MLDKEVHWNGGSRVPASINCTSSPRNNQAIKMNKRSRHVYQLVVYLLVEYFGGISEIANFTTNVFAFKEADDFATQLRKDSLGVPSAIQSTSASGLVQVVPPSVCPQLTDEIFELCSLQSSLSTSQMRNQFSPSGSLDLSGDMHLSSTGKIGQGQDPVAHLKPVHLKVLQIVASEPKDSLIQHPCKEGNIRFRSGDE